MQFKELKKYLRQDFSEFPVCRLALLGDSATQFLTHAIKAQGYFAKIAFEIFEADFDQLDRQILDAGSELYQAQPQFVVIYACAEKLWDRFTGLGPEQRTSFADTILAEIRAWWDAAARHSQAKIIQLNFVEINDGVFGHFGAKTPASFTYQIRKLNFEIM